MKLTIATRKSLLALWQSEFVAKRLSELGHEVGLLELSTRGDEVLDRSLSAIGGKNLFIKELEIAMQQGRAQLAVHSLKDVGAQLAGDFVLAAVCAREDERDVVVLSERLAAQRANDCAEKSSDCVLDLAQTPTGGAETGDKSAAAGVTGGAKTGDKSAAAGAAFEQLGFLPQGAVVGTTSLRRCLQLGFLRPDLRIKNLRGNLQTRLAKLDAGEYDAIVLARAGLVRLGLFEQLAGRIVQLSQAQMISAAGQGAVAIEALNEPALLAELKRLECPRTRALVGIERDFTRVLNGGCGAPIGINASVCGGELVLRAIVGNAAASKCIQMCEKYPLDAEILAAWQRGEAADLGDLARIGEALALKFIAAGARELIEECEE